MKIFQNKVVVKIAGGLGNQLFQYAIGRAIAIEKKLPLWLDISAFKNDISYKRVFVLDQFNIQADKILFKPYLNIKFLTRLINLYKKIDKYKDKNHKIFIYEPKILDDSKASMENYLSGGPCHKFSPSLISNLSNNIVLDGYWQSEKYFIKIKNILLEELKITAEIPEDIKKYGIYLKSVNSVAICVRQYTDSETSSNHFKLTKNYYDKAINIITKNIQNPHFFIFTLETQWAKNNIQSDFPITVVPPNTSNRTAYQDLYLLSKCKHFIIANSTYHWWGAYLAKNNGKIVISPSKGWGNSDPLPDEWIKL